MRIPRALTIAGSDSGGGAGIQADLKTFSAFRVFGMSVITAVTAQNSIGVQGVESLPPAFVAQQLDSVLDDFGADAVKCGMLATAPIIQAVAEALRERPVANLVVDPVMVAKSGDPLLPPDARRALVEHILPLALVVTPNLPEAGALTGFPVTDRESMEAAITLAGTGHLCIETLHANNSAVTLDRIINMFPRDQHDQVFLDLSQYLRAIISLRLVRTRDSKRTACVPAAA